LKLKANTDLFDAIEMLINYKLAAAPVVDEQNTLIGILSESDCLNAILTLTYHEEEHGGLVGDYMCKNVYSVEIDTDIIAISKMMIAKNLHSLPIVRGETVVGQINRRDVLGAVESFTRTG
ncbi:MAG: CBS domain-containing protein, partial [Pseudomonadales bacterium]